MKLLKQIFHYFFDKPTYDCCYCINGTSTGEWCRNNCHNGDKFEYNYNCEEKW